MSHASVEEITAIDEIGEKIAISLKNYFSNRNNKQLIKRLKNKGLQFEIAKGSEPKALSEKLAGLTVVISGVFYDFSREELKTMIEAHGGKIGSSISSKTNYLITGDNMGPAKLEKAKELNIHMINEKEFLKLIT